MSGVKGIRFRGRITVPDRVGTGPLACSQQGARNAPGAVQRAASPGNPAAVITGCRKQGTEVTA